MEPKFKVTIEAEEHRDEYEHYYTIIENVTPESLSLRCPHCSVYSAVRIDATVKRPGWQFHMICSCPNCENTIFVEAGYNDFDPEYEEGKPHDSTVVTAVSPQSQVINIPAEIPELYRNDYREAILVRELSPKASAALSRRILQNVLREEFNIKDRNLEKEIEQFIVLKDVPSYLAQAVDAIRAIGNLAAHPMKDTNTGAIAAVEPGEAEWLLEVLSSLFDFTFVQPKRLEERRNNLNARLQSLGKPPLK